MSPNLFKRLERTLRTQRPAGDPEVDALAETAGDLRGALARHVPDAERERTLFASGIAARRGRLPWMRVLAPALAVASVIAAVGVVGRSALPGQTLFPVRKALGSVGLASSPADEIDRSLETARELIADAWSEVGPAPTAARHRVFAAVYELQRARRLVAELTGDGRRIRAARIRALENSALDVFAALATSASDPIDEDDDRSGREGGDDSSGTGSGDDDRDDSSGSGSADDDRDDSSGSGSGDDDRDDSSGSGSGDDDRDDSSGSGSGGGDRHDGPDG